MSNAFAVAFLLLFVLAIAWSMIKAIREKKYLEACAVAMMLPFAVMIGVQFALGGRPAYDAEAEYELYQAGCYYLRNGSEYTEVTQSQFVLSQIVEITGLTSIATCFILSVINTIKKKSASAPKTLNGNEFVGWND